MEKSQIYYQNMRNYQRRRQQQLMHLQQQQLMLRRQQQQQQQQSVRNDESPKEDGEKDQKIGNSTEDWR